MIRSTTPILSLLIAVLMFLFFTQPQFEKVKDLQGEIVEYEEAAKTYSTFSSTLDEKLQMKNSQSAYEMDRLDALVPEEIDGTRNIVDLEAIAERSNMLFNIVSVSDDDHTFVQGGTKDTEEAGSEELTSVDISFEVVGTYEQFKQFLRSLEKSLTPYEITKLTFVVEDSPFQQYSFTVRTYALPNK